MISLLIERLSSWANRFKVSSRSRGNLTENRFSCCGSLDVCGHGLGASQHVGNLRFQRQDHDDWNAEQDRLAPRDRITRLALNLVILPIHLGAGAAVGGEQDLRLDDGLCRQVIRASGRKGVWNSTSTAPDTFSSGRSKERAKLQMKYLGGK